MNRSGHFRLGLEVLLKKRPQWLTQNRIGLLCHPASTDRRLIHSVDRVRAVAGASLVALFGPQHGVRGEKQDNMIESDHSIDPGTGVPVYSLYGEVREPGDDMLRQIDILLIDLQDVGTRVYTFIATLAGCMGVAARLGTKVIVLDRPNPIGGTQVEGNVLESDCRSFVGEYPIPMRHGMTMGELAQYFNRVQGIGCDLEVITMEGWSRQTLWPDLGLHWVSPSPNMPSFDTALVYPGAVLFEGTNLSEGRGTTRPFESIGAPFVDPQVLAERLSQCGLSGVRFRAMYFEPTFHKWSGELCGGIQIHVTNPARFKPYQAGLALLQTLWQLYPDSCKWRDPPYEYEYKKMPIDLLIGSRKLRTELERGRSIDEIKRTWAAGLRRFRTDRNQCLLYD